MLYCPLENVIHMKRFPIILTAVSVWSSQWFLMIMLVDTSDAWRCLFEGHSMCQEDTRHSMFQDRKTDGHVHKRASRRCSLCVRALCLQPFLTLNILLMWSSSMWMRINMVIAFRIAGGGWWLEEGSVKPKSKTASTERAFENTQWRKGKQMQSIAGGGWWLKEESA